MSDAPTDRTEVRRLPERAVYDRGVIDAILDEALVCHVGVVHDGWPAVVPTIHARVGGTLYFHGSPGSRVLRDMKSGAEVCVAVTLLDGLVVARASFHNTMNYRSVVIYGAARLVDDPAEKLMALDAVTNHVLPGRTADARPMSETEVRATLVMAVPVDESSAKVRTGGPEDDDEDYALGIWAGVVPLALAAGTPQPDDRGVAAPVPDYLIDYRRP